MRLSPRLKIAFDQLIPGQDVWDICCDHGYLGTAAYKSQEFKNIYFVDPVESIMNKLQDRFRTYVFDARNSSKAYFLVQKAEELQQDMTGTVVTAGVGGLLIYQILKETALNGVLKAQRLILGPHRDGDKLLSLMKEDSLFQNYILTTTKEIIENNRQREFFIFSLK